MSNKLTVNIRLKFLSKYGLVMYFAVQSPTNLSRLYLFKIGNLILIANLLDII